MYRIGVFGIVLADGRYRLLWCLTKQCHRILDRNSISRSGDALELNHVEEIGLGHKRHNAPTAREAFINTHTDGSLLSHFLQE
jgi:hypothetical protein